MPGLRSSFRGAGSAAPEPAPSLPDLLSPLQVPAAEDGDEEEDAQVPWDSEESDRSSGEGGPVPGPDPDGSRARGVPEPEAVRDHGEPEPASPRSRGVQEEEEEEEEEGSCCSDEGEDSGDVYFYYTVGERWIDYLERTEEGGLIRHVRPKVGGCEGQPPWSPAPERGTC